MAGLPEKSVTTVREAIHLLNTCAKCEVKFHVWSDYYRHLSLGNCARVIRPKNTSGRSKGEIVMNAEKTWLKPFVVAMMLAFAVGIASANCGNDNGNGNGCSDSGSSQGPAGPQGPTGATGATGAQGAKGTSGTSGTNGTNGTNGANGSNGTNGTNGKDGSTVGTHFSESNLVADTAVRLYDGKRIQIQAFNTYAFGRHTGDDVFGNGQNMMYGARIVLKLGKSYEERRIDEMQKKIDLLTRMLGNH